MANSHPGRKVGRHHDNSRLLRPVPLGGTECIPSRPLLSWERWSQPGQVHPLLGTVGHVWRHGCCWHSGGSQDAAEQPTMHRTAPEQGKNRPAPIAVVPRLKLHPSLVAGATFLHP